MEAPETKFEFGVGVHLEEGANVFFHSLFRSTHLGKTSDLLAARIQASGVDELKLRLAFLYNFFHGYWCLTSSSQEFENVPGKKLDAPLTLECGVDSKIVAVGIEFKVKPSFGFNHEGVEERLESGELTHPFERSIHEMAASFDRVILKFQKKTGTMNIVLLIALDAITKSEISSDGKAIEWQMIPDVLEPSKKSTNYREIGDEPYHDLLKDELKFNTDKNRGLGGEQKISGDSQENDLLARSIKGGAQEKDNSEQRFKADAKVKSEDYNIKRGEVNEKAGNSNQALELELYKGKIAVLQEKIVTLETQLRERGYGRSPESGSNVETVGNKKSGIFGKLFKAKSTVQEEEEYEEEEDSEESEESSDVNVETAEDSHDENKEEIGTDGLDRTIKKVEKGADEIKSELKSNRAKKWVDGLMEELVGEKHRIQELSKKLSLSVKQKEMEYISKERVFEEEIKRKDEAIRQKDVQIQRAKEQLSQTMINMERAKGQTKNASAEIQNKKRITFLQKQIDLSKDENQQLKEKLEELSKKMKSAALGTSGMNSELATIRLKEESERNQKAFESQKRQNQQLLDRIQQQEKRVQDLHIRAEEMKEKLEKAMRLSIKQKEEIDRSTRTDKEKDDRIKELELKLAAGVSDGKKSA